MKRSAQSHRAPFKSHRGPLKSTGATLENNRGPLKSNGFLLVCIAALWMLFAALCIFFPGMTTGNFVGLVLISTLAVVAVQYTPLRSRGATAVVSAVALLLGLGVILNAWYFTTYLGGTPEAPILINDDSHRWWNDALYNLNPELGQKAGSTFLYYGVILSFVLRIFGATVGCALLWSMTLILASVILCGILTYRLTRDRKTSVLAMVCVASVCYWLSMGTLILKDAFIILTFLIMGIGFTGGKRQFVVCLLVACLMLSPVRPIYNALLALGCVVVFAKRGHWGPTLFGVGVCVLLWYFSTLSMSLEMTNDITDSYPVTAPQQMAYFNIIGNYVELPWWQKILLLPVTAGVQFLIPFSWTFARDIPFGLTQVWAHIGYPWYIFGFIFVYYLVSRFRDYRTLLYRLSVWAMLCWLFPCLGVGGTVSRYGLPFVALMAPAVAVTLMRNYKYRRFYVVLAIYAVVLAAVLVAAYHLQTDAAV